MPELSGASPDAAPGVLVLTPGAREAGVWVALALALVGLGIVLIRDSSGHPLAFVAFALFWVVASYFVAQLALPRLFRVELDTAQVRARLPFYRLELPWRVIHAARLTRVAGDRVLQLHVREQVPGRAMSASLARPAEPDWTTRVISVLLPIGCDTDALDGFLERRLGRSPLPSDTPDGGRSEARE